jgi:hypothetical protein
MGRRLIMSKIFTGRIFAYYSQFLIFDANADLGDLPDWTKEEHYAKGYMSNGEAISIVTYAGKTHTG